MENWWKMEVRRMIRIKLTKAQAAKLEDAKPSDLAVFVMGYAQRHPWPAGERWSLVVTFCDYPKATNQGRASHRALRSHETAQACQEEGELE